MATTKMPGTFTHEEMEQFAASINDGSMTIAEYKRLVHEAELARLGENIRRKPTTWDELTHTIGRNLLPTALSLGTAGFDLDELAIAVEDAWTLAEFPMEYLPQREWLAFFTKVGYLHDTSRAARPVEPITVFRGSLPGRRRRWSWTTDLDRARWFRDRIARSGHDARVWTTVAPPEAQLAYFGDARNEEEHVILTAGLKISGVAS